MAGFVGINDQKLNDDMCRRALNRAHNRLVAEMEADVVMDGLIKSGFLSQVEYEDLQNLQTKAMQNRILVSKISQRGMKAYCEFKKCLIDTKQEVLVKELEEKEKELITEIERFRTLADGSQRIQRSSAPQQQLELPRAPALQGSAFNVFSRSETITKTIKKDLHDGRLYELNKAMVEELKSPVVSNLKENLKGAFGNVYISREDVPGFNLRVVLKEIDLEQQAGNAALKLGSVTNEKIAARLMHFGIVPLLAYYDDHINKKYYFVSPYFENGDLFEAIKEDTAFLGDIKAVRMNWKTRVKVMYQIACAIDYMHTGNTFRGKILHMDIKSKNIVLDAKFNARLIDFGLARELKEGDKTLLQSSMPVGTMGYLPTVQLNRLTEQHDYHSYGVVLLELITGLDPLATQGGYELRNWPHDVIVRKSQTEVWKVSDVVDKIVKLATSCIGSVHTHGKHNQNTSKGIISTFQNICRVESVLEWDPIDGNRCEICLVNEDLKDQKKSPCKRQIRTCCSCMRNSYINPVQCQCCCNTIEPFINAKWGAILVAGYDVKKEVRDVFLNDIDTFHEVTTSKFLPAMCLNSDDVVVVTGNDESMTVVKAIENALNHLSQKHIQTLLFVYSGHGGDKGLFVGENELYSMDQFCEMLSKMKKMKKREIFTKVIVFQDCCCPKPLKMDVSFKWIQLNATGQNADAGTKKPSADGRSLGYSFLKYILQVFTARANGWKCEGGCDCTSNLNGDFITLDDLRLCLKEHRKNNNFNKVDSCITESHISLNDIDEKDTVLAYNYRFEVKLTLRIDWPGIKETMVKDVFPCDFKEFQPLKLMLAADVFKCVWGTQEINVKYEKDVVSKFAEIMAIEIDTGPKKEKNVEEMCSKEQILLAWNSKRLLRCTARRLNYIDFKKPVGYWLKDAGNIQVEYQKYNIEQKPMSVHDLTELRKQLQETEKRAKTESLTEFIDAFHMFINNTEQLKNNCLVISFVDLPNDSTLIYMQLVPGSVCVQETSRE